MTRTFANLINIIIQFLNRLLVELYVLFCY